MLKHDSLYSVLFEKGTTMKLIGAIVAAIVLITATLSASAQDDGLVIWADDTRAPILEELGAQFEEEFGIAVRVDELGFGDIRDQFKTAAPAGEGPDMIIGAHDWLGELAVNGLLAEIDVSDVEEDFLGAALSAFVYEGVQYGLPYAAENVAFLRNVDLVPDNPVTWDGRAVRERAADRRWRFEVWFCDVRQQSLSLLPGSDGFWRLRFGLTDDGYNPEDVGIDSEGSIAAAAYLEAYGTDGLMPSGIDYDVMHTMFETGDAAMIITGPWAIPRIEESGVNFAVDSIPAGPGGSGKPFLGVQGFMISAFSGKPVACRSLSFRLHRH